VLLPLRVLSLLPIVLAHPEHPGAVNAAPTRLVHATTIYHCCKNAASRLKLIQFTSDTSSFNVGSTLILGPTEAILVDAEYHMSDARREADSIAKIGRHLKAIVITHPDEDHYFGARAFVDRFPGTPVYMTATAIEEYNRTSARFLEGLRKSQPAEAPDSLVTPQTLPTTALSVDGERVEVVADLQGDVLRPSNSFLWIPSLRTVIAGDIVFNQVNPWLAASDVASRQRWHESIRRIADLHPVAVIAAHKRTLDTPDAPEVLQAMDQYLTDFDAARQASPDAEGLAAAMSQKYPNYAIPMLLRYSAMAAYRKPRA
jgi:glyoxylase-like metal-dependent hydrolase (beta-lactamase superfamily II)